MLSLPDRLDQRLWRYDVHVLSWLQQCWIRCFPRVHAYVLSGQAAMSNSKARPRAHALVVPCFVVRGGCSGDDSMHQRHLRVVGVFHVCLCVHCIGTANVTRASAVPA